MQDPTDLLPEGARLRPPPAPAPPLTPPLSENEHGQLDDAIDDTEQPADFQRGNRRYTLKVVATAVPRAVLPLEAGRIGIAREDLPKSIRASLKETGEVVITDTVLAAHAQVVMEHDFKDYSGNGTVPVYHIEGFLFQMIEGDSIEFTLELHEERPDKPLARDMRPRGWLEADADAR